MLPATKSVMPEAAARGQARRRVHAPHMVAGSAECNTELARESPDAASNESFEKEQVLDSTYMLFWPTGAKATRASGLSHFHCANDHSEEKYLGNNPFSSPILDVVFATAPGAADAAASPPSSSEKMWMVPAKRSTRGVTEKRGSLQQPPTHLCRYCSRCDCPCC